jgi:cell division protein FtsQ
VDGGGRELQQIGDKPRNFAVAIAETPSLPMRIRRAGWLTVTGAQRRWVLHKKLILRVIACLAVAVLIATGFQFRGGLANALGFVTQRAETGISNAGLAIEKISLTGYALTGESALFEALEIHEGMSLVSYDADAARARLEALPAIATAHITKNYPSGLTVSVSEKTPIARWRVEGVTFAIDAHGDTLVTIPDGGGELPLFVGDGAASGAALMLNRLEDHPLLKEKLMAISRIAERRWDLIYDNGLRIMLPETGVDEAMATLVALNGAHELLARDIDVIDMRVPDMLAVRPVPRDADGNRMTSDDE